MRSTRTRRPQLVAAAAALAIAASLAAGAQIAAAGSSLPYVRLPSVGDVVRLDGSLGGQTTAWAYADVTWLETYLQATMDAAAANTPYQDVQDRLDRIAPHVTAVPNGTRATVETVQPFIYKGRADVEVRVNIQEGPMRGRELWTTCAELIDSAGHRYLRV